MDHQTRIIFGVTELQSNDYVGGIIRTSDFLRNAQILILFNLHHYGFRRNPTQSVRNCSPVICQPWVHYGCGGGGGERVWC